MKLVYNVHYGVAAIIVAVVLYAYLCIQYSNNAQVNREYKRMLLYIVIADILDVVTAITISYGSTIPIWINRVANTLFYMLIAILGFQFVTYATTYIVAEKANKSEDYKTINTYVLCVYFAILAVNWWKGVLFYFDDMGTYTKGPWYWLVFLLPLYFVAFATIIMLKNSKESTIARKFSLGVFFILSLGGQLIQMLAFPNVLLGMFTVTLAAFIMQFTLETVDYRELIRTTEQLKIAKEEAEAANNAKTEFLGNMSHELRTPINAVLGYNEMISRGALSEEFANYSRNVDAAGKRLLYIVNDILDFSQLDSGIFRLEEEPYEVMALLQDIIIYAKHAINEKHLSLELRVDNNIPRMLKADAVRLSQVINNLVSNAIKYTAKGSVRISVKFERDNADTGRFIFAVTDTGIGMKQEDINNIVGSFQRAERNRNKSIQGMGLGLTIVTYILELMGSRLQVESTYGKGSTFGFSVTQKIIDGRTVAEYNRSLERKTELRKTDIIAPVAKLLVVDDNEMNLDLFKGIIKNTKMTVDTATSGFMAIETLKSNSYDMIFLDLMMPEMDGIETLKEIKRLNLCSGVPIIAFTANAIAGQREKCLQQGFDAYLTKPILINELMDTLKRFVPIEYISSEDVSQYEVAVSEKISQMKKPEFLDYEVGLEYCGNDKTFYREMLIMYSKNTDITELDNLFEKEQWKDYEAKVHSLKSTSLTIGAVNISDSAKALEQAVKEEDYEYIQNNHKAVMGQVEELIDQINSYFADENSAVVVLEKKHSATILVVDDQDVNLRIAQGILGKEFDVEIVRSGKLALECIEKEIPDLILLDLHMPEMDGFEVLEHLQRNSKTRSTPVIFLTGDEDREAEIRGFEMGAQDFIKKPFVADVMRQRVARILELDRLRKNLENEVEKKAAEARRRSQKVERISYQTMRTLASTIDAKDKYTNGHSLRVAKYSKEIAKRYGKSEREQEEIYFMGLLHDIGKIGIPNEIINKTDKLTDEEYDIIKTHPVIGSDILKNISEIPGIATGARWHHERYDGKGYPDGLKGNEIPEVARIIGVADAYDAMTSNRSYRGMMSQNDVREQMVKGTGTQFDPVFAKIMLEMMDEDKYYIMHES